MRRAAAFFFAVPMHRVVEGPSRCFQVTPLDAAVRAAPSHGRDTMWHTGPVTNVTNSGNPMYLRTYIAEVSLCQANDALLRMYHLQVAKMRQVHVPVYPVPLCIAGVFAS